MELSVQTTCDVTRATLHCTHLLGRLHPIPVQYTRDAHVTFHISSLSYSPYHPSLTTHYFFLTGRPRRSEGACHWHLEGPEPHGYLHHCSWALPMPSCLGLRPRSRCFSLRPSAPPSDCGSHSDWPERDQKEIKTHGEWQPHAFQIKSLRPPLSSDSEMWSMGSGQTPLTALQTVPSAPSPRRNANPFCNQWPCGLNQTTENLPGIALPKGLLRFASLLLTPVSSYADLYSVCVMCTCKTVN